MPSSSTLPTPEEWLGHRGSRQVDAVAFVAALGVGSIAVGFGFVAIDKSGGLKYALLFGAVFLLAAAYGYVTQIRPRHREIDIKVAQHDGSPATELRYSGMGFGLLVALMACMTAIFGLASGEFFLSDDDVTLPQAGGVVFGAVALFLASFLVAVARGKLSRGRVVLSQRGIFHRGRAFSSLLCVICISRPGDRCAS